ncbi:bZIP transcription factor [Leucobacter chromiiresistens]|uniref:Uncharacterized protein n=1 Tax=Leucobacter chromiiresistens TaxID=1079994 RepID=A0A1H1BBK2_9MICO|nr:WVD2 family protein [Leucobacter chromiiresistens]SDQ49221.1 hypothetical protein SAMN04488565_2705 [Leucobacter chromiiresistens]
MLDSLSDNRRLTASILWIPFSWLVQALGLALVATAITALLGFRGSVEPGTALLIVGALPIIGLIVAALAALFVTRSSDESGSSRLARVSRAFFRIFSLPARWWVFGFGWVVKMMVVYAVAVIIGFVGLLITGWAISILIDMGANGLLVILVGVALPFITIGGAAWGNQYGSGTTGGMPSGIIIAIALAIIGGFFWFWLLILVLALFALPASIVLFAFSGGDFSSPSWEPHELAIAIGAFLALTVPPIIVERSGELGTAFGALADRIPYFGPRRRARRNFDAAVAESRRRQAEEQREARARAEVEQLRQSVWAPAKARAFPDYADAASLPITEWGRARLELQRVELLEAEVRRRFPLGLDGDAKRQLMQQHPWASSIIEQLA